MAVSNSANLRKRTRETESGLAVIHPFELANCYATASHSTALFQRSEGRHGKRVTD